MEQYNNNRNQDIKRQFVDREVYAPAGTLVEFILKKASEIEGTPFSLDDITNLYCYKDSAGNSYTESPKESQLSDWLEELEEAKDKLAADEENAALISRISALENDIEELENAGSEMVEIYEWWPFFKCPYPMKIN